MKKWQKITATIFAGVVATAAFAGCKPEETTSADPKTINVEISKLSYGVNWAYEVAKKFETVFADQGYKVNFLRPSSDMRGQVAINQLALGYEATKADMYITGSITPSQVGKEGNYGVICEELSSLWEKKPIGYDGQEETKTLRQKTTAGIYDTFKDIYGDIYGVPYMASTGGMVVNTRKLALYGINTLPKTSNELFDMWTKIYTGANGQGNSEETGLFPFTYMPGTGNAYTIDWFHLSMAQYDEKMAQEYWSWQTDNGNGTYTWWENDVTAAANDALLASYEVMAQAFDINMAAYGTSTQTLDQAQAQIMKQNTGAIFMCNGSWYLNDMALGYKHALDDITFINFPVVSKLGLKLWGAKADEAKCEEMLRYAINQVDDLSKIDNPAAIATDMTGKFGITVTEDEIKDVRRARYVYSNRTTANAIFLAKDTPKRDICELFIRMIASDDAVATIAEFANVNSAYTTEPNTTHKYEFIKAASRIRTGGYAKAVSNTSQGYRFALGRTQNSIFTNHIPAYIAGLADSLSIYDGFGGMSGATTKVYRDLAADMFSKETAALAEGLATWKKNNADRVEKYRELLNPVS